MRSTVWAISAFDAFDHLFALDGLLEHRVRPIDSGDIGIIVQPQVRVIAQEPRDGERLVVGRQQRMLRRGTVVAHHLEVRSRQRRFDSRFDLLDRFHNH